MLDQRGLLLFSSRTEPLSQGIILFSALYAWELDIQERLGLRMFYFTFILKTYLPVGSFSLLRS